MPLRVTKPDDPVDAVYASFEEATGDAPDTCPWASLDTDFVGEVIRARNWREHGELEARYPNGVPNVIVDAIDCYDAAFNATQVADMRADAEAREEERKRNAELNKPHR